jgi:hypothetical protein
MRSLRFTVLTLAFFLSASTLVKPAAHAQAISQNGGSIQGSITDPSGAAIPGANIVISSPDTGYAHTLRRIEQVFIALAR